MIYDGWMDDMRLTSCYPVIKIMIVSDPYRNEITDDPAVAS